MGLGEYSVVSVLIYFNTKIVFEPVFEKEKGLSTMFCEQPHFCGELKDQETRSQKTQELECSRGYCETKPDAEP